MKPIQSQKTQTKSRALDAKQPSCEQAKTFNVSNTAKRENPDALKYSSPIDKLSTNSRSVQKLSTKHKKGKQEASNLNIESFDAFIGEHLSAYEIVSTNAQHHLQVNVRQGLYRKEYKGIGNIQTNIVPTAEVGQAGKLTAIDLNTEETLEIEWQWHCVKPNKSFWQKLKSLFVSQ